MRNETDALDWLDLGDQSFDDYMDAFDFEDPSDEYEQGDGVSVWDGEVEND